MKKTWLLRLSLVLILSAVMLLSVCSCGDKEDEDKDSSEKDSKKNEETAEPDDDDSETTIAPEMTSDAAVTPAPILTPEPVTSPAPASFTPYFENGVFNGNGFSITLGSELGEPVFEEDVMTMSNEAEYTYLSVSWADDDPTDSFRNYTVTQLKEFFVQTFEPMFGNVDITIGTLTASNAYVYSFTFDVTQEGVAVHAIVYMFYVPSSSQIITLTYMLPDIYYSADTARLNAESIIYTLILK